MQVSHGKRTDLQDCVQPEVQSKLQNFQGEKDHLQADRVDQHEQIAGEKQQRDGD